MVVASLRFMSLYKGMFKFGRKNPTKFLTSMFTCGEFVPTVMVGSHQRSPNDRPAPDYTVNLEMICTDIEDAHAKIETWVRTLVENTDGGNHPYKHLLNDYICNRARFDECVARNNGMTTSIAGQYASFRVIRFDNYAFPAKVA